MRHMLWHFTLRIIKVFQYIVTDDSYVSYKLQQLNFSFFHYAYFTKRMRNNSIPQYFELTSLNPAGLALREYFLRLFHHDNFIISIHFVVFLESMLPFLFSMKLSHLFSDIIKASSFWTMHICLLLRSKVNIHAIKWSNKINMLFISHFWFQTEKFIRNWFKAAVVQAYTVG